MYGLKTFQQKFGEKTGRYEKTEVDSDFMEVENITLAFEKAVEKTVKELYPRGALFYPGGGKAFSLEKKGETLIKGAERLNMVSYERSIYGKALLLLGEGIKSVGSSQSSLDGKLSEQHILGAIKTFAEVDQKDVKRRRERFEEARLQYDRIKREQTRKKRNEDKLSRAEQNFYEAKDQYLIKAQYLQDCEPELVKHLYAYTLSMMQFHEQIKNIYEKTAHELNECFQIKKEESLTPPPGQDFLGDISFAKESSQFPTIVTSYTSMPLERVSPTTNKSSPSLVEQEKNDIGLYTPSSSTTENEEISTTEVLDSYKQAQYHTIDSPELPPLHQPLQPQSTVQSASSQSETVIPPPIPEKNAFALTTNPVPQCEALYDFVAQNANELSFHKGDIIKIIGNTEGNWWHGELKGTIGEFPSNFVHIKP